VIISYYQGLLWAGFLIRFSRGLNSLFKKLKFINIPSTARIGNLGRGKMHRIRLICSVLLLMGIISTFPVTTCAGPPFLTDDPEPVPFKHWEFYLFSTVDAGRKSTNGTGPAFEFNVGALPNLQVHLILPLGFTIPKGEPSAYGLGDMEFGLKYRFIQETDYRPMVGVFPQLEIPTGDANRGLGNGRAWGKFPLWLFPSGCRRVGDPGRPTGEPAMPSIPPQNSATTSSGGGSSNVISVSG